MNRAKSFDLIVKVKDDARDEMEKIRNLMVDTNDGRKVPLNYVAEVVSVHGTEHDQPRKRETENRYLRQRCRP